MRILSGSDIPPALKDVVSACREHFVLAATLSALINVLYLAPTIYMLQVYDRVVPTGSVATLAWITLVVALALGTLALLDAIRSRVMIRASLRIEKMLYPPLLHRLFARAGIDGGGRATAQPMRELDTLRQACAGPPAIVLFDVPWTPIYVLVATLLHPLLGIVILVGAGMLIAVTFANGRATRTKSETAMRTSAAAFAILDRLVAKAEIVRALGMRRAIVLRQLADRRAGLALGLDAQMQGSLYTALAKFLRLFMQSIALGCGAWLAIEHEISVGSIIAASILLSRALQPVEQMVAAWPAILQARHALDTLSRLFRGSADLDRIRTSLPPPAGQVELQRVSVRRSDGTLLLKNVSFELTPGSILGVIGPSGAGKTTLARVITGALPPSDGVVRYDGADIEDWDPEALGAHIGYLAQDVALLPGTIAENISRFAIAGGAIKADIDEKVIAAARAADVHELILQLRGGYDAWLEGSDYALSAGQRQRIALARALYDEPALVVLDEPNSALDAAGEQALARAISAARERGAAVVIITHRSSILRMSDDVLFLNNGMIERFGPRPEVLEALTARARAPNVFTITGR